MEVSSNTANKQKAMETSGKLCRWLPGCPLYRLVEDPLLLLWHWRHRPYGCRPCS
ncbi:UNVERIFIED_CONTAM: hypothetical protein Slati_2233100 [Sesamum latifolium]|uniref:Uncharacterized protein n=1 Tax=Sesamum latifolium TaxID=2727402 RepID=A0AAW2WTJ6_9LAMI